MKRERENSYIFLEDFELKWCKNGGLFESDTVSLRVLHVRKTMNSYRSSRENWKSLKTDQFAQNTRFLQLNQVACKSLEPTAKTLKRKTFEKFSKCFSRLKVPLMRELRSEMRKSLCTSRDWTFNPRSSHQPELRNAWKSKFLKNILSLFRDWSIYQPMSREKSLYGLTIRAYDWFYPRLSRQNRATQFLNFWQFFVKRKYFQKTTKTLKKNFVIDQQRLSMWKHI